MHRILLVAALIAIGFLLVMAETTFLSSFHSGVALAKGKSAAPKAKFSLKLKQRDAREDKKIQR